MTSRKLSPDDVARTALRVLDELGLPDLTMRRLAAELGVQPSALYWHFPDKQTLLAAVSDRILPLFPADEDRPAADGDWGARLHAEADALRGALLAHRDSAEVVSSTIALGLGADPGFARLRRALEGGPFDAAGADRAAAAVLHLVLGQVSLEQQRLQYEKLGVRAAEGDAERPAGADAEDFRFGIAALITGLRAAASSLGTSGPSTLL